MTRNERVSIVLTGLGLTLAVIGLLFVDRDTTLAFVFFYAIAGCFGLALLIILWDIVRLFRNG